MLPKSNWDTIYFWRRPVTIEWGSFADIQPIPLCLSQICISVFRWHFFHFSYATYYSGFQWRKSASIDFQKGKKTKKTSWDIIENYHRFRFPLIFLQGQILGYVWISNDKKWLTSLQIKLWMTKNPNGMFAWLVNQFN